MGLINWFLSKSSDFNALSRQLRSHSRTFNSHKRNTKNSFQRVRRDNILIAKKLKHHEKKIFEFHNFLQDMIAETSEPIKVYKKKSRKKPSN